MFVMFCFSLILVILIVREHKVVLEDLDKAQVDILHVGSNRKNAADDKLKQLMRRCRLLMRKQEIEFLTNWDILKVSAKHVILQVC